MYKDRGVTDRYTYRQLKLALHELYKGYTEGGRWQERKTKCEDHIRKGFICGG